MVQSVELLLDEAAERLLVEDWRLLTDAGLASQGRHTSPSNRPHVTLAAVDRLDEVAERRVAHACRDLPALTVHIGPLVLLGGRQPVLARLVVATAELLALQSSVAEACALPPEDLAAPGRWLPHATLARRMPVEQVSDALGLLPRSHVPARVTAVRRWDSEARRTWLLR